MEITASDSSRTEEARMRSSPAYARARPPCR
jgi:hypothetical protein